MKPLEHTLEFLLAFNGRIHFLEEGYWIKFEIKRVQPTDERPHGLSYSFTLHAPSGKRLIGFDNAHAPTAGARFKRRPQANDHWHRTEDDPGRPYDFKDAATLIDDFFDEAERVLNERGIAMTVVKPALFTTAPTAEPPARTSAGFHSVADPHRTGEYACGPLGRESLLLHALSAPRYGEVVNKAG